MKGVTIMKKILLVIAIVMTLLFVGSNAQENNVATKREDDSIEWHSYEEGDVIL